MPKKKPPVARDATGVVAKEAQMVFELYRRGHLRRHPSKVVAKLEQILRGRPSEDEFQALLTWLGRAKVIHALDQQQLPPASKGAFQVPDLLAVFDYGGRNIPVLIEVKHTRELRFTERYYTRLSTYAESLGLPLLVAWKIGALWTLVPLAAFQRVTTAWRCSIEQALLHNVMSVLAGDYGVAFVKGTTCRMLARRDRTISSRAVSRTKRRETWQMTIEDFSVMNRDGEDIPEIPNLLFWIWITLGDWDERVTTTSDTHEIVGHHLGSMGFLQQCLPLALEVEDARLPTGRLWKSRLDTWQPQFTAISAREAVVQGLRLGLVRLVADILPKALPAFLPKLEPDTSRYSVLP